MNAAEQIPSQAPAPPPQPAPVQQPVLSPAFNDPRRKKPLLASLLSILPGLGQVYVGYYKRGFVNAITVALLITLINASAGAGMGGLIPLGAIFLAFFWFYNIIDAGRSAALYNQALAGGAEIELPQEFEAPGLQGSLVGGAVLIVIGLVLLSNTLFGVSLDWLQHWWPVAVIVFGGYLVYKALQERSAGEADSSE